MSSKKFSWVGYIELSMSLRSVQFSIVVYFFLPEAFMHAEMDEWVHVQPMGTMAKLLLEIEQG